MWLDLNQIWARQPHPTGERHQVFPAAFKVRQASQHSGCCSPSFSQFWFHFLERKCCESCPSQLSVVFFEMFYSGGGGNANLSPCPSGLGVGGACDQAQHVFFWIQTPTDQSHARGAAVEDQWAVSLSRQLVARALLPIKHWKNQSGRTPHICDPCCVHKFQPLLSTGWAPSMPWGHSRS